MSNSFYLRGREEVLREIIQKVQYSSRNTKQICLLRINVCAWITVLREGLNFTIVIEENHSNAT